MHNLIEKGGARRRGMRTVRKIESSVSTNKMDRYRGQSMERKKERRPAV